MAYTSGTASSMADLKTALENACVANGWTLTSGILSKSGTYFQLTAETAQLTLRGGTGQTGATLDDQPAGSAGARIINSLGTTWTYPVNYEIHNFAGPDEVYFIVNYNADYYQHLNFGKSDVLGIGGTGNWFTGSYSTAYTSANAGTEFSIYAGATDSFAPYNGANVFGLFTAYHESSSNSYIHTGLEVTSWKISRNGSVVGTLLPLHWAAGLIHSLPNLTNNATVLIPVKAIQIRNSGGRTIVANPKNARFLRIDYINPGDIITFGAERWKVYPFYRKNASERNGVFINNGSATHSGTIACAIRYTGA